jgi:hypothetical protein
LSTKSAPAGLCEPEAGVSRTFCQRQVYRTITREREEEVEEAESSMSVIEEEEEEEEIAERERAQQ